MHSRYQEATCEVTSKLHCSAFIGVCKTSTLSLQSDAVTFFFFFFLLHVSVWLLFKGGVYFFGKPADINDSWIRYVRAMQ